MQKPVNLADLVRSFRTSIYLQKSASIQPRTSPPKFQLSYPARKFSFTLQSHRGRAELRAALRRHRHVLPELQVVRLADGQAAGVLQLQVTANGVFLSFLLQCVFADPADDAGGLLFDAKTSC